MEPAKRWLLWIRWLAAMTVVVVFIPMLAGGMSSSIWMKTAAAVAMLTVVVLYKPFKQKVEIVTNSSTLVLILAMSMSGRITMQIRSAGHSKTVKLGSYFGVPVWFEHTVEISGHQQRLLVYFRFPNGFMVSHGLNEPPLNIARNEVCI